MKKVLSVLFVVSFYLPCFSTGYDWSDIPEECLHIVQTAFAGLRDQQAWKPAENSTHIEEGKVVYEIDIAGAVSVKSYFPHCVDFMDYDPVASIEAFFASLPMEYSEDQIYDLYELLEETNYSTEADAWDEVERNVEEYLKNLENSNLSPDSIAEIRTKVIKAWQDNQNKRLEAYDRRKEAIRVYAEKVGDPRKKRLALLSSLSNSSLPSKLKSSVSKLKSDFIAPRVNMKRLSYYLGFAADWNDDVWKSEDISGQEGVMAYNFQPAFDVDESLGLESYIRFGYYHSFLQRLGFLSFDPTMMYGDKMYKFFVPTTPGFKGFQYIPNDIETHGSTSITNMNAVGLTAPKNWVDGSSVIVTNGKFSVKAPSASGYALKFVGTTTTNSRVIGGPSSKTNTVMFASAADSNVSVTIGDLADDIITVTIGVYYK